MDELRPLRTRENSRGIPGNTGFLCWRHRRGMV